MQRVPFVPDLLDLVLPTSSVEELEIMLQQLSARESDIQIEMQIAKRLQEDIPGEHIHTCCPAQPGGLDCYMLAM